MSTNDNQPTKKWYGGTTEHEGFPLLLRFPERPDFDALPVLFPKLLVVTHVLLYVEPSGMPEAEYNQSLAGFDHDLVTAFEKSVSGITVLVETYNGNRTYYMYTSAVAPILEVKDHFLIRYPEHALHWELKHDPEWTFIKTYAEKFSFYE